MRHLTMDQGLISRIGPDHPADRGIKALCGETVSMADVSDDEDCAVYDPMAFEALARTSSPTAAQ
jgi:hypothetical protein